MNYRSHVAVTAAAALSFIAASCGDDDATDSTSPPAATADGSATSAPVTESPAATDQPESAGETTASQPTEAPATVPAETTLPPVIGQITQPSIGTSVVQYPIAGAVEMGLFRKYGLEVEIIQADSAKATPLFLSGETKFATLAPGIVTAVAANGVPIDVYAVLFDRINYSFWAKPEYSSLDQLTNGTIGITAPGGLPDVASRLLFEHEGIPTDGMSFAALGGVQNILTALLAGEIDAAVMGPPDDKRAELAGMVQLADIYELNFPNPGSPIGGDPAWVAENTDVAKAYLKGLMEMIWQIHTQPPEQFIESMGSYLNLPPGEGQNREILEGSLQRLKRQLRPPREMGDNEVLIPYLESSLGEGQTMDVEALMPDIDLMAELEEEGFFDELEAVYGPVVK